MGYPEALRAIVLDEQRDEREPTLQTLRHLAQHLGAQIVLTQTPDRSTQTAPESVSVAFTASQAA